MAGTCLAWTAWQRGRDFRLTGRAEGASWAALGLVNPLTGPRLSLAWPPTEYYPDMLAFYRQVETALGLVAGDLYRELPIYRPFTSAEHRRDSLDRLDRDPQRRAVVQAVIDHSPLPGLTANDHGGLWLGPGGRLDVPQFLTASAAFFRRQGLWQEVDERSPTPGLTIRATGVDLWRGGLLPAGGFQAVKGEVLLMEADLNLELAVAGNLTLVPGPQPGLVLVGATHEWDNFDATSTLAGRDQLLARLAGLSGRWRVLDHRAGIRPATRDHFPIIGRHPGTPDLAWCGGLGARGVAQAPLVAAALWDHLDRGANIPPQLSVERLFKSGAGALPPAETSTP